MLKPTYYVPHCAKRIVYNLGSYEYVTLAIRSLSNVYFLCIGKALVYTCCYQTFYLQVEMKVYCF